MLYGMLKKKWDNGRKNGKQNGKKKKKMMLSVLYG
jgi:hypothetical protein